MMPGAATGSGELYEDDGESEGYLKGEHAITTWSFAYSDDMSTLSFAITQPEGASYHGMPSQREYEVQRAAMRAMRCVRAAAVFLCGRF